MKFLLNHGISFTKTHTGRLPALVNYFNNYLIKTASSPWQQNYTGVVFLNKSMFVGEYKASLGACVSATVVVDNVCLDVSFGKE